MEQHIEQKALLTVAETAIRLGVGRSYVYELVMRGNVRSIKLGRARRIPIDELEAFIARKIREAHPDASC